MIYNGVLSLFQERYGDPIVIGSANHPYERLSIPNYYTVALVYPCDVSHQNKANFVKPMSFKVNTLSSSPVSVPWRPISIPVR